MYTNELEEKLYQELSTKAYYGYRIKEGVLEIEFISEEAEEFGEASGFDRIGDSIIFDYINYKNITKIIFNGTSL